MKHSFQYFAALLTAIFVCGCASERPGQLVPKVAFTFDDSLSEYYDVAAPILEKYGFRGTFNVIVGQVGNPDRMTWEQIADLNSRGHAIENHTMTHADLVKMAESNDIAGVQREVTLSRDIIASRIGRAPTLVFHPHRKTSSAVDLAIRDSWQKPMPLNRRPFGEGYVHGDVTRYIEEQTANGNSIIDLFCHGVSASGPGYKPFANPQVFEDYVKEVRELADRKLIKVVLYRDCEVY